MNLCTQCDGYKPDRMFYSSGPGRLMSECRDCNRRRKAEAYVPRQRTNQNLGRDRAGRFRKAA